MYLSRTVMVAMAGLGVSAFVLRVLLAGGHSAFMDESSYILTGRILFERHEVYAGALEWTFGSYLWPLLAGAADMLAGPRLVRTLTAAFGVVMTLATVATAYQLAPRRIDHARRWAAALLAGLIMAVFPTAIAIGRFGTYDALAGAAFMSGVALLVRARVAGGRAWLLGAAGLLFVGFLAKYLVALYFPLICLYLLASARDRRALMHTIRWFVAPLSAACAVYFLLFHRSLFALLAFSANYTGLKSDNPVRDYLLERPEVWLLALVAALGWRRADRLGRGIAVAGAGALLAFQALARPDHDFWKHSIYMIFFLAPLAGLALAPAVERVMRWTAMALGWQPASRMVRVAVLGGALALVLFQAAVWPDMAGWPRLLYLAPLLAPLTALALLPMAAASMAGEGGAANRRASRRPLALTLAVGASVPLALVTALTWSNRLVTFYPDLNPSLAAIRHYTAGAERVLTDDSALRYHLYEQMPYQRVTDPFYLVYGGEQGLPAYRLAVADRLFDTIVLDGGIESLGQRLRPEIGGLLALNYNRVYQRTTTNGALVEIYQARDASEPPADEPASAGATVTYFDDGTRGWGGHPDNAELQPGFAVAISHARPWHGRPSLQFTAGGQLSLAGVRVDRPVSRVDIDLYIVPTSDQEREVRVGMTGFDANWQWRDDGFRHAVRTGRWTRISWELEQPGVYRQIGVKLPSDAAGRTVYLGRMEIRP